MGLFDSFFGGGGGGGGAGSQAFAEFLEFIRENRAELEQLSEREREQAVTFASLRRGELLDRPGFAGLVQVGEAQRRTDASLASDIQALDIDDPTRLRFEEAIRDESIARDKRVRVLTGEQFRAEDAFERLKKDLKAVVGSFPDRVARIEEIRERFLEHQEKFEFFSEDDNFIEDIEAKLREQNIGGFSSQEGPSDTFAQ